jgi:hypothetical protein
MMELAIFYTNQLPRRHVLATDLTGANLANVLPGGWKFWKTTTAIPGVLGYDPDDVQADIAVKGWSLLRYKPQAASLPCRVA